MAWNVRRLFQEGQQFSWGSLDGKDKSQYIACEGGVKSHM
jgi:hypothetical protein